MKKSFPIIASIFAVSILQAFGQDAVVDTSVNAPVNTSTNTNTHADTPINTHANTSIDTSFDTLIRTTVSTFSDTLIHTSPVTRADTQINISGNIMYNDTLINTPVSAPAKTPAADTQISAAVNTPVKTAVDTPVNAAANQPVKKSEKIFLLPSYTFHVIFLAVSVALIAATLYFFIARLRRNDSRRFLTTTRLSVLDKLVQRGCRHIESNYADPALTPETVCNSLVTGKAYLDALFMNELGINVQDFIVQVRVNAIKHRLAATPQTAQQPPDINEICAECGFADKAEAERCFAAVCGGVGIAEFARFSKMQNQLR